MTQPIKEMDDSYANGDYTSIAPPTVEVPPMAIELPVTMQDNDVDPSIAIGDVASTYADPKLVSVYADSITPVSYGGDDSVTCFDVVFNVACTCPDSGNTTNYKVVKRIGVDRLKMAADAKISTPVSIVEAKKPIVEDKAFKIRMQQLAGLSLK